MILTKMRNCRFLLPLAKFAKVMFLHLSVILVTGGGESCIGGWAGKTLPPPSDTMGYGQRAGGTHHTGIHSCF